MVHSGHAANVKSAWSDAAAAQWQATAGDDAVARGCVGLSTASNMGVSKRMPCRLVSRSPRPSEVRRLASVYPSDVIRPSLTRLSTTAMRAESQRSPWCDRLRLPVLIQWIFSSSVEPSAIRIPGVSGLRARRSNCGLAHRRANTLSSANVPISFCEEGSREHSTTSSIALQEKNISSIANARARAVPALGWSISKDVLRSAVGHSASDPPGALSRSDWMMPIEDHAPSAGVRLPGGEGR